MRLAGILRTERRRGGGLDGEYDPRCRELAGRGSGAGAGRREDRRRLDEGPLMVKRVDSLGRELAPEPVGALAGLADQADADDQAAAAPGGAAGPAGDAQAAPPPSTNEPVLVGILTMFRELGARLVDSKSLFVTLADPQVAAVARVCAPVFDKYGIDLGAWFAGPELVALTTAGPILWVAWRELDHELRARRAKPVAAAPPDAPPAPPTSSPAGDGIGGPPPGAPAGSPAE